MQPVQERVNDTPERTYLPYQVSSLALYKHSMWNERGAMAFIIPDWRCPKGEDILPGSSHNLPEICLEAELEIHLRSGSHNAFYLEEGDPVSSLYIMGDYIARTHGCVRYNSETHGIVLRIFAGSAIQ